MTRKHGMIEQVDAAIGGNKDDMIYDRSVQCTLLENWKNWYFLPNLQ